MIKAGAIILAAGQASRAGGPKAIWPIKGQPSVRRVALAALGAKAIGPVVVVVGGWADEVEAALTDLPVKVAVNPNYAQGQAGSLSTGLLALGDHVEAAVFLLADQPFITSQIIDDLVSFLEAGQASLVAPIWRGERRNPAVFSLNQWREKLLAATGDQGGRGLFAAHPEEVGLRPFGPEYDGCFDDFDTPDEYERLNNESKFSNH